MQENNKTASPASILPNFLKIIRKQLCQHRVNHSVNLATQEIFIVRMCGITTPLRFLDQATKRLDGDRRVKARHVVFKIVFYSANQDRPNQKTNSLGITRMANTQANRFIRRRALGIWVGGYMKAPDMPSRVLQGSILGLKHSFIFISDIAKGIWNSRRLFADDFMVTPTELREGIEAFKTWSSNCDFSLNLADIWKRV